MNRLQTVQVIVSIVALATAALFVASGSLLAKLLNSRAIEQADWAYALIGLVIYLALQAILFATLHGSEK